MSKYLNWSNGAQLWRISHQITCIITLLHPFTSVRLERAPNSTSKTSSHSYKSMTNFFYEWLLPLDPWSTREASKTSNKCNRIIQAWWVYHKPMGGGKFSSSAHFTSIKQVGGETQEANRLTLAQNKWPIFIARWRPALNRYMKKKSFENLLPLEKHQKTRTNLLGSSRFGESIPNLYGGRILLKPSYTYVGRSGWKRKIFSPS